jgi:hypothetical protein
VRGAVRQAPGEQHLLLAALRQPRPLAGFCDDALQPLLCRHDRAGDVTLHLSHEILYVIIASLAGILVGIVAGICLLGAWLMGWLFAASVPEDLATNDMLSESGKQRSKLTDELPFAWSDKYDFTRDEIGNVTYQPKIGPDWLH